jgi:hypothetical protein
MPANSKNAPTIFGELIMKPKRFTTTCAAILLGLSWSSSSAQTTTERDILVEFYEATNGDDWYNSRNWRSDEDHCRWYGVRCIEGSITEIRLPRNNVVGPLGTMLFELESLRDLDLSDNGLHGSLPDEVINGLPQFDFPEADNPISIILSGNRLSGNLPPFTRTAGLGESTQIDLGDNLLTGPLPPSWVSMTLGTLGLSDNAIGTSLAEAWQALPSVARLDLGGTGLTGPFPETPARFDGDDALVARLQHLNLSRNQLSGELANWFVDFDLRRLRLQHNGFTGGIDVAIEAMTAESGVILDLSHNQFSGEIPEALSSLELPRLDDRYPGGGHPGPALDLCWNEFDMPGPELIGFIKDRHHGGSYLHCQTARKHVSPTISGSWYDPDRSGEGFVQHVLDNGQVLLFWFTFTIQDAGTQAGQQAWFLSVNSPLEKSLWLRRLLQPVGKFGFGNSGFSTPPFWLSIDPLNSDTQQISYSRSFVVDRSLGNIPSFALMSDRQWHTPLTRLAGTTCDNKQPHQWISGAWYDPQRSGEGFVVDVNSDGRVIVYWFTFEPNDFGHQAWMIGTGEFTEGQVVIDEMTQPVGTGFGSDFDESEIELIDWGSLTLTFDNEDSGHIWYESRLDDYGSGNFPIERLARPMLADCE